MLPGALICGLISLMSVPSIGSWGAIASSIVAGAVASRLLFASGRSKKGVGVAEERFPIGAVAGSCAHDLNNLLTAITGAISILERATEKGDLKMQRRVLSSIEKSSARCRNVVDELLCVSRAEQGKLSPEPIDVGAVLSEVLSGLSLIEQSLQHRFSIIVPDTPVYALGHEAGLHKVLMNLGINAIDAMEEPGNITFEVVRVGLDRVAISVSDTGCGIPKNVQASMFDPFFTTKKGRLKGQVLGGNGLGLSSVKLLVSSWGGTIEVASAEGKGATFTVLLHRVDSPSHDESSPSEITPSTPSPVVGE